MQNLKRIIAFAITLAMLCMVAPTCFASESIVIDSVEFSVYTDDLGFEDSTLVNVKVTFSAPAGAEEISLLLTGEDISEINNTTKAKIIHMDQFAVSEDGVYECTVEKSRIAAAIGNSEIDGATLYLKMGGKNVSEMVTTTVIFEEPALSILYGDVTGDGEVDIGDAIKVLRYDAGLDTLDGDQFIAGEVTGDGEVDIGDAIKILRYDAGLEESVK
jgi:hypothetical protein